MRRSRSPAGGRAPRVTQQVHHELAELVRTEVKDPRVGLVTITGVEMTPDYAYATVYFSVLPDDEETMSHTLSGLQRAAGFLRTQLARRVRIHTTPQLRFRHDRSVERGMTMSRLIDQANERHADD